MDLEARAWVSGLPGVSSTRLQQSGGGAAGWLRAGPVGAMVVILQGRTADRIGQTYNVLFKSASVVSELDITSWVSGRSGAFPKSGADRDTADR